MAETSGFQTDLPQSAYLSLSIRRAISAAQQRSHRYVTLEHLLLALLDDPNAVALLEAVRADLPAIRASAADTVNRNLATLYTPGQFDLRASYKVERVLQTASDDAARLGCGEVDAAFVLATLSRESDNPAAEILKRNGFTYSGAMTWLYTNRGVSMARRPAPAAAEAPAPEPAPPAPEPEPARAEPAVAAVEHAAQSHAQILEPVDVLSDESEELELVLLDSDADTMLARRPGLTEVEPPAGLAARSAEPRRPIPISGRAPSPAPARETSVQEAYAVDSWADPDAPEIAPPPPNLAPRRRENGNGAVHELPTPAVNARRAEPQLPSAGRLEEMRLRGTERSRAPLAAPVPGPRPPAPEGRRAKRPAKPAPAQTRGSEIDKQKARARRQPRALDVLVGRLIENIPRRMREAVPERIEVRISREETEILAKSLDGRADAVRHELTITQTMSVTLRAPDAGFNIEPLSPETQWIFDRPDPKDNGEPYGRWRWVVTPSETGQRRLQLIISARSVDKNGLVGDTALPDQIITVRVRTNYLRTVMHGLQWIAAMLVGGVLTELALIGMRAFTQ